MNNNSGKFKYPKCGYNKFNTFKNWLNREEFLNNEVKTKWIFYKEEKKEWECCICCRGAFCCRECAQSLICCCTDDEINNDCIYIFYPCYPCT